MRVGPHIHTFFPFSEALPRGNHVNSWKMNARTGPFVLQPW